MDLWLWSLDDQDLLRRVSTLLSQDERSRASRFVHKLHQDRFTTGRGRLREILGGYLDRAPEDLAFRYAENGKPSLAAPSPVRFNLSHTEGVAALTVAHDIEIGVDIEGLRPVERDLPNHYFSAPEREELAKSPDDAWLGAFHRCWTRKEAIIKALGDGLSIPLDSFAVTLTPGAPARLLWRAGFPDAAERWVLAHFEGKGFVGAVAAETGGAPLSINLRSTS